MKIFISSLITGLETVRAAAKAAIEQLGHEAVMAEQFVPSPNSPQVACLQGLRESGLVILILGANYGTKQASGLSATHEEYRAAKGAYPVIAFVQDGVDRDPDEKAFVTEVQGWEGGLFRGGFTSPDELRGLITRAIHQWELAKAAGPLDTAELLTRALAALPTRDRHGYGGLRQEGRHLLVSVAAGPGQTILRPSEIESAKLGEDLVQRAMFGAVRLFDMALSTTYGIKDDALVITQGKGAEIRLDPQGGLRFSLPLSQHDSGWPVVIEEDVAARLASAVSFTASVLDHVDPTQRLTHVAIAATLDATDSVAWRTQREHEASRNSFSMGHQQGDRKPVHLTPPQRPRAALSHDTSAMVEDFVALLRRAWKTS